MARNQINMLAELGLGHDLWDRLNENNRNEFLNLVNNNVQDLNQFVVDRLHDNVVLELVAQIRDLDRDEVVALGPMVVNRLNPDDRADFMELNQNHQRRLREFIINALNEDNQDVNNINQDILAAEQNNIIANEPDVFLNQGVIQIQDNEQHVIGILDIYQNAIQNQNQDNDQNVIEMPLHINPNPNIVQGRFNFFQNNDQEHNNNGNNNENNHDEDNNRVDNNRNNFL